jgi:hypothetical protein
LKYRRILNSTTRCQLHMPYVAPDVVPDIEGGRTYLSPAAAIQFAGIGAIAKIYLSSTDARVRITPIATTCCSAAGDAMNQERRDPSKQSAECGRATMVPSGGAHNSQNAGRHNRKCAVQSLSSSDI